MSRGTIVLGGQLSGGTVVWGDTCPGGTLVRGDSCPGGQLSRGTNVRGTLVGGTNVTPPYIWTHTLQSPYVKLIQNDSKIQI